MTRSCSAWMVATTSLIRPVRRAVMLAISMASPDRALPVRLGQPVQVEDLVVDPGDGAVPGVNVAAPDQPGRVFRGGGVEGVGGGRTPVDELWLVLVVPQADPADVQGARAL